MLQNLFRTRQQVEQGKDTCPELQQVYKSMALRPGKGSRNWLSLGSGVSESCSLFGNPRCRLRKRLCGGCTCERKEVISQDHFQTSTSEAQASQVSGGSLAPSGKSTWWDLAAQGMRVAAGVRAGPGAGLGDRLWRWLDRCKCRSVQSRVYMSGGGGTGRRSLRDTVERRLPVHGHLQELGHKVGSCLGLLDPISLHDSALFVQA